MMTDPSKFAAFEKKMVELVEFANQKYNTKLPLPKLEFVRMGTVSGRASFSHNRIQINPDFFGKHYDDMLNKTLPHEVAHLVAPAVYGPLGYGHKMGWKMVMRVFGLEPKRCHQYDASDARMRNTKKFVYTCECKGKDIEIGANRHNKMTEGRKFFICPTCKTRLKFSGKFRIP